MVLSREPVLSRRQMRAAKSKKRAGGKAVDRHKEGIEKMVPNRRAPIRALIETANEIERMRMALILHFGRRGIELSPGVFEALRHAAQVVSCSFGRGRTILEVAQPGAATALFKKLSAIPGAEMEMLAVSSADGPAIIDIPSGCPNNAKLAGAAFEAVPVVGAAAVFVDFGNPLGYRAAVKVEDLVEGQSTNVDALYAELVATVAPKPPAPPRPARSMAGKPAKAKRPASRAARRSRPPSRPVRPTKAASKSMTKAPLASGEFANLDSMAETMAEAAEGGKITRKTVVTVLKYSRDRAAKLLARMADEGVLEHRGKGALSHYVWMNARQPLPPKAAAPSPRRESVRVPAPTEPPPRRRNVAVVDVGNSSPAVAEEIARDRAPRRDPDHMVVPPEAEQERVSSVDIETVPPAEDDGFTQHARHSRAALPPIR